MGQSDAASTAPIPDAHAPNLKSAAGPHAPHAPGGHASVATLALGALGVVYGDIGTSPLYALRESIVAAGGASGVAVAPDIVIGVLSLILWSLMLIVTIKYVLIVMHADNNGEGGTLTLVALVQRAAGRKMIVLFLGMAGAALFFGDAVITPAISVLSAVEGLKLVTPFFESNPNYVIWIAVVILLGLFAVQSRGTAMVAQFFGPITLLWFITMAGLGLLHIADDMRVLAAINPWNCIRFFIDHPGVSLAVLGSVCLAVTGAEALYADMGHFGRKPIQGAWLFVVLPALALNYLGQGALILSDPSASENPFFRLAPSWFLLPLVILATAATIIASQAVITGAFSLTRQAIQLGILPRLEIRHTSETQHGQIYIPRINSILRIVVIVLVLSFQTSSALAHAYGIAVFGTMALTSLLATVVIWKVWNWKAWAAALMMAPFLFIESAFLTANLLKVLQGGFVPILLAVALVFLMATWVKGNRILFAKTRKADVPFVDLVNMLSKSPPHKVSGTAVFLTSDPETAPTAMLHNLKHNKVLHEKNVVLTVKSADTPRVPESERVLIEPISEG
ncbi:MAG: potassium transporter Kup, partial [Beijerinckiaceae bacterium]